MSTPRRGRPAQATAPVIITVDGEWCTACGWEPDTDTRDPYLLRVYALEHRDTCPALLPHA